MFRRLFAVVLPLLLFSFTAPAVQAAVFKCDDGSGNFTYRDQPCAGGQPLTIAPPPAASRSSPVQSLPPSQKPAGKSSPSRAHSQTQQREERKEAAHKKKCEKLALRRQWADQDMQAVRAQPLRPQDKKLDSAQRKLRRTEEQYRLECGPGSSR